MLLTFLFVLLAFGQVFAGEVCSNATLGNDSLSYENRIKQVLFAKSRQYDPTTRPVKNDTTPVVVNIAVSLYHILDTNEKFQTIQFYFSIRLTWVDEYMKWDKGCFGNISKIWTYANKIWTPDAVINNNADDAFVDKSKTLAIISSNGKILWMYPAVVTVFCTLDVKYFPFDEQACQIKFISWTYSGNEVDWNYNESIAKNEVYYKKENQEWFVQQNIGHQHNKKRYACCDETYPDMTFTIMMKRRSLFYIFNLIFPCMLIFLASFMGFFLPIESSEKISLEMTILLALVVFLMFVGEQLPPTPDAIPLLGMLFGVTMAMVSIALLMAVIVTNLYFKKDSSQRPPRWLRRLFSVCQRSQNMYKTKASERKWDRDGEEHHKCNGTASNMDEAPEEIVDNCENYELRCFPVEAGEEHPVSPEVISTEWRSVAHSMDRTFFWFFFAIAATIMISIFAHIPQELLASEE